LFLRKESKAMRVASQKALLGRKSEVWLNAVFHADARKSEFVPPKKLPALP
jgi:hypothetical protein